jgi:hypothetical protein
LIAPIRGSQQDPPSTGIQRARRAVAAMLLLSDRDGFDEPPALPGWKAWVLAAWITVVLAAYVGSMLGVF